MDRHPPRHIRRKSSPSSIAACPSKLICWRSPMTGSFHRVEQAKPHEDVSDGVHALRDHALRTSLRCGSPVHPDKAPAPETRLRVRKCRRGKRATAAMAAAPPHLLPLAARSAGARAARSRRSPPPEILRPRSFRRSRNRCHRTPPRSPCPATRFPPCNWLHAHDDAALRSSAVPVCAERIAC